MNEKAGKEQVNEQEFLPFYKGRYLLAVTVVLLNFFFGQQTLHCFRRQ